MANASLTQRGRLFGALHALADEIAAEKTAAARVKVAGPTPSDPGGYQGKSSHPSANVDNNVQSASEGARSSENKSDVKEDQGAPSVDSTPEGVVKDQDKQQLNIGTQQSATGEDPSTEDSYKGTKDDPGTSHPAKTTDGEKYGSAVAYKEARDKAMALSNELLADLANGFGSQLQKQAEPAPQAPAQAATVQGTSQTTFRDSIKAAKAALNQPATAQAMQEGYELAALLGLQKDAAVAEVEARLADTIRDAQTDADLLGSFLTTLAKRAAAGDDAGEGEDHSSPGDETSGEGAGDAAGGAGGEAGAAPPGLEGILQGAGGGGEPGLDAAPPNEEEALQELAAALEELGIPLDVLLQAAQEQQGAGGAPGGAPGPDAGGPPMGGPGMEGAPGPAGGPPPSDAAAPPGGPAGGLPPKIAAAQQLIKLAHAVHSFKLSGKYQLKTANPGSRSRELREIMKGHVRELLSV